MSDFEESGNDMSDEQREQLRKAISGIVGDFHPWVLCVDTTQISECVEASYCTGITDKHSSTYTKSFLMEGE